MAESRMLSGSPILMGDNSIPGVKIHSEVKEHLDFIMQKCREFGLDFYPTIIEFLTYDEISEIASYGGFPVRYPHWRFGMEYESLSRGYEYGQHRIGEMIINTSPCLMYCLDSNTLTDNINVIVHAMGHNDFFKNNIHFSATDTGMMNKFANHSSRIRKYMARWGKERVTEFIDHCLRLDTLIDPHEAWKKKKINKPVIQDSREYNFPNRRPTEHDYMEPWINSKEYMDKERAKAEKKDLCAELELFAKPQRDVFRYLRDHAPLKPWQQDIVSMLYEEAIYFTPQRATKTSNEGFASWTDYKLMCEEGLCGLGQPSEDGGIIEYAKHKMQVLGGKYSQNPYKLGFELLMDVEDRWNKGRFGREYEECRSLEERENWNKNLGLGKEKVFEVRKFYNDATLINEFFTKDFCDKHEYYEWQKFPNGEYKIVSRDFPTIKKKLIQKHTNGGLPDIRLTDPNHRGKGWMLLQHYSDGRTLYDSYARETLTSLYYLWQNTIMLSSKDDEREFVYFCHGPRPDKDVEVLSRRDYEKNL